MNNVRGAKGVCQRCGFKYLLTSLRKEWTGFKVCKSCWDPVPKDLKPPKIRPEGLPKRNVSPEPAEVHMARFLKASAGSPEVTPNHYSKTTFGQPIDIFPETADQGGILVDPDNIPKI